jgi:hypothetical protein
MPLIMFVSSSFNTYVNLPKKKEEEDTKIIKGIPQIYIENRNIKQQMVTG